jgi:hypothetical protein
MSAMKITRQRGAATLVVVMVLFFIISMVAAYTSRNMIFEQRTGANLYRATQSLEAAEAGMEWALMLLNSGRIDEQCVASSDLTDTTFRDRYLQSNPVSGLLTARTRSDGTELTPGCLFDRATNRWNCSCPVDAAPSLVPPTGDEIAPAFRVRFRTLALTPAQPALVRIDVVGCTRLDDACLVLTGASLANEGRTVLGSLAMLSGRAMVMPRAALTARGNVSASSLVVSNVRVADGGVTVHASGTIDPGLSLTTIAGNALGGSTIPSDSALDLPALTPFSASQRFFASMFLLTPERWMQQPAVVTLDCGLAGCSAAEVRDAISENPGRPLWVNGNVSVDSSGDIGTATEPVLMVINGGLDFSTTGVTVHGLVVIRPADPVTGWVTAGSGRINGAVIVDGAVTGTGAASIEYNGEVLTALRASVGNMARVSGSWRDWALP